VALEPPLASGAAISVVVPALNLASTLPDLLLALDRQRDVGAAFECIVVDDGSTDQTAEAALRTPVHYELRVLRNAVNEGRSAARNRGWRAAGGELVVFLDGDMVPESTLLRDYARALTSGQLDVLCGTRLNMPKDSVRSDQSFDERAASAKLGQYPSPRAAELELALRELCQGGAPSVVCAFGLITSNSAVRRSALADSGGFDVSLRRFEDTELGIRLWQSGARFGFVNGARAIHSYAGSDADRGLSLAELQGMFWRHPRSVVVATYLWLTHQLDESSSEPGVAGPLAFAREPALAERAVAEFRRRFPAALPARFDVSSVALTQSLECWTGWPIERCQRALARARAGGLHVEPGAHTELWDSDLTRQWLCVHDGLWDRMRELSPIVTSADALVRSEGPAKPLSIEYTVHGDIWLTRPTDAVDPASSIEIDLPHGGDGAGAWAVLAPAHLGGSLTPTSSGSLAIPLRLLRGGECIQLDAVLTLGERASGGELGAPPAAGDRGESWSLKQQRRLDFILSRAGCTAGGSATERARRLYDWVLDTTIPLGDRGPELSILETGVGNPSRQALLFASLCRRSGIAARLRRGWLLSHSPRGDGLLSTERLDGAVPTHAWAEFHAGQVGWVSVDFVGGLMARRNPLRRTASGAELEAHYFGRLDPFRLWARDTEQRATGAAAGDSAAGSRRLAGSVAQRWTARPSRMP
jgi:GT2 family glycosyltransferase